MSVFNGERYLREAVDSILAQSFTDLEFLVLDDGSTDGSLEILRAFEKQDGRIRIISRPNKGLTRSLNDLVAQSKGDFLARMDCDDIALPDRLAVQVQVLRSNPDLFCVGGYFELIDAKGRELTVLKPPVSDAEIQRQMLVGHVALCHPTVIIRRSAIQRVGGYCEDFKTAQDLDLWLRLGEIGKLANVEQPVLKFRLHDASISESKGQDQHQSVHQACQRAWLRRGIANGVFEADEHWRPGKDQASRAKFALRYGWWAFNGGHRRTAIHYGIQAVEAAPTHADGWKLLFCAFIKPMPSTDRVAQRGDGHVASS